MKKLFISIMLLSCLIFAGSALAADRYVNGIDANYPPFAYVDESGKAAGFDVESMNWIAERIGFEVEHKPMDWDGIIASLLTKKIDMVCSGMSISPERKAVVTFSDPYYTIKKYLMVQKDSGLTKEVLLTGNKKIGVQRGTNEAEWLEQNAKAKNWNYELRYYDSAPMAVEDLVNGRIDSAAIDSAPAEDAMNKYNKPIVMVGEFAESDQFGVATRNEDVNLRNKINEGYKMLKADPYWEELKTKHGLSK